MPKEQMNSIDKAIYEFFESGNKNSIANFPVIIDGCLSELSEMRDGSEKDQFKRNILMGGVIFEANKIEQKAGAEEPLPKPEETYDELSERSQKRLDELKADKLILENLMSLLRILAGKNSGSIKIDLDLIPDPLTEIMAQMNFMIRAECIK